MFPKLAFDLDTMIVKFYCKHFVNSFKKFIAFWTQSGGFELVN